MQDGTARRTVLAAAVALPALASGCKGLRVLGPPPRPRADVAVAREAIAGEALLISRYRAVLAAVPALAGLLRPMLAQHTDHLARLRSRLIDPHARQPASPAAGPHAGHRSPTPAGTPATPGTPSTAPAALAYLRDAEHAAAASLLSHLEVASPSFAQLLTSIAASEATHALVLGSHRAA